MEINQNTFKHISAFFYFGLHSLISYQKLLGAWLILVVSLMNFQCNNDSDINIRTISIVSDPTYKDIKIITENGREFYRQLKSPHPDSNDSLLTMLKSSNTLLTNLLERSNLINLRDDILIRMNYYGIEDVSQNKLQIQDVDSLLKLLNIRNFIDFRAPDGQILKKIITSMEFGNLDSINRYGIRLHVFPKTELVHKDETLSNILLDSLGIKAAQGFFSMDNLTDIIRDGLLIDQLSILAKQNGAIFLVLIDSSNEKSIRKLVYLYYQYIDSNSGFLKIAKVCINPYHYYPKHYE